MRNMCFTLVARFRYVVVGKGRSDKKQLVLVGLGMHTLISTYLEVPNWVPTS